MNPRLTRPAVMRLAVELSSEIDQADGPVAASWIHHGLEAGYPECCIRHFILARLGHVAWQTPEIHPLDGRRMCSKCVAKLDRAWPTRPHVKP